MQSGLSGQAFVYLFVCRRFSRCWFDELTTGGSGCLHARLQKSEHWFDPSLGSHLLTEAYAGMGIPQ